MPQHWADAAPLGCRRPARRLQSRVRPAKRLPNVLRSFKCSCAAPRPIGGRKWRARAGPDHVPVRFEADSYREPAAPQCRSTDLGIRASGCGQQAFPQQFAPFANLGASFEHLHGYVPHGDQSLGRSRRDLRTRIASGKSPLGAFKPVCHAPLRHARRSNESRNQRIGRSAQSQVRHRSFR